MSSEANNSLHVIACQYDIAWEDPEESCRRVLHLLRDVDVAAGSLIVLPEMFSTGFSMDVGRIAEGEARIGERFCADTARRLKSYVTAGVVNRAADGRGRNESVTFGPEGKEAARYCKLHPFSYAGETDYFESGDRLMTFECGAFVTAPLVCYDLRFPEVFRRVVRWGAQLFTVVANWPAARAAHWRALLIARAIENQAYVVGVNRSGEDPNVSYVGGSMIVDPRGQVLAEGGASACVIEADLNLDELLEYRGRFPALRDMRDDL